MKPRRRAGVTLMELLIAVSLVSLLSLAILMSIRVGLNAMEKTNTTLMANRRVAGARRVLEHQFAGLMPVVAPCRPAPQAAPVNMLFFQGEPEAMRFVSSHSLQEASRGYPRILEFQVLPGEDNRGVRLVVNELLYTGPFSVGPLCLGLGPHPGFGVAAPLFLPIQAGPASFVLADKLAYCRFAYQEVPPPPAPWQWVPLWVKPELPRAVRIEMAPLEPHPARLGNTTFVLPLRVNRTPIFGYVD